MVTQQMALVSQHSMHRARPRRRSMRGLVSLLAGICTLSPCVSWSTTTVTNTTSFDYDLATGALKKVVFEPTDSNLCLVTEYTPDDYGRQKEVVTRNCTGSPTSTPGALNEASAPTGRAAFERRKTENEFSSDQRFVAKITNPLGHVENLTYDPRFGTVATRRDANDVLTSWTFDSLGRKTLETRVDGATKWEYVFCTYPGSPMWTWPLGDGGIPIGAVTAPCDVVPASFSSGAYVIGPTSIRPTYYVQTTPLKLNGSANGAYTRVYFDALGREIRSETQGSDVSGVSALVYADTAYEMDGGIKLKGLPYYPGTTPSTSVAYRRDILGRLVREFELYAAGGPAETLTTYSGLTQTVRDPKGFRTVYTKNIAGQVAKITDAKNGELTREYDPLGNLVRSTDAMGNVTSTVYDVRGRRTAVYDPDLGVWSYTYNAAGEVVLQTDAKSQPTELAYDKLGRLTRRLETDLESNWYFDDRYAPGSAPCSMSIGKLCEATATNAYRRRHGYDLMGRSSSVTTYRNGTPYTTSVDYDAETGRLVQQQYPTGLRLTRTYSPLGYPLSVVDQRNGVSLWTALSQDAQGQLTQFRYGNNIVTTNAYFRDGRIKSTQAGSSGGVQSLVYGYDLNRNINTRLDVGTGLSTTYIYDELNRLKSESRSGGGLGSTPLVTSWDYDAIGNIVARTENGVANVYNYNTSGLGSRFPHAVGSVSGAVNAAIAPRYRYDDNGNLTSGADRVLEWTNANMVKSITARSSQLSYRYSPERDRYEETYTGGGVSRLTVYVNPSSGAGLFYEEETGSSGIKKKHYVSAGGATVAMIVCRADPCTSIANTSTQYWHEDHLGSVSAVTDEAGSAPVERMAYEPFGKRRQASGQTDVNGDLKPVSTDRGFTEHEHLDEVALINMNGRVYDPALNRFLSADPTVPYPDLPQSYNRYSYGRNNPLRNFDPSGFEDEDSGCHYEYVCLPSTYTPSSTATNQGSYSVGNYSLGNYSFPSNYLVLSGSLDGYSTGLSSDPLWRGATLSPSTAATGEGATQVAGQGLRATRDFIDGGYGTKTQEAWDRGDVSGVLGNTLAGATYGVLNVLTLGEGAAISKLGTSAISKGVVALDTNALIAATQEGKAAEVLAAIAGRTPVVSRTAVREFLAGGNSIAVLREYLSSIGGRIAAAGTEAEAAALRAQATQMGRSLGVNDSRVGASAAREGAETITNDKRFRNFLNAVGLGGIGF